MATEKPSSNNKIQSKFKSRRMSHQSVQIYDRPMKGSQKYKKLKIKASNIRKSTSRSRSSQKRGSLHKKVKKVESLMTKLKRDSINKSPFL